MCYDNVLNWLSFEARVPAWVAWYIQSRLSLAGQFSQSVHARGNFPSPEFLQSMGWPYTVIQSLDRNGSWFMALLGRLRLPRYRLQVFIDVLRS